MSFAKKYTKVTQEIQRKENLYDNGRPASDKKEFSRVATWTQEAWGNHVLEIQEVRLFSMGDVMFEKEDGTPVIAEADKISVDFVVVSSDTLDEGTEMVWSDNAARYPKTFVHNCLGFVSAATKAPIKEVTPEDIDLCASEDQPLKGATISARIEQFVNYLTGEKPIGPNGEPRTRCTFNAHFGELEAV